MLEVKPLYYFVAAYEEGSVSAAALRCNIAQPSITHAIKALEHRLKATLFDRSRQGVRPTDAGRRLYKLAIDLLMQNQQIVDVFTPEACLSIKIYIQPDINIDYFQPVLQSLATASARFNLVFVDSVEQAQIAVIDEELVPARFQFFALHKEPYRLAIKKDHSLAKRKSVTLVMLESLVFIERPYCTKRKAFERQLNEQGITITYQGKAAHDLQIHGLIKLGLGVAVIPESYCHRDSKLAYLPLKLSTPITRSLVLAHRQLPAELVEVIGKLAPLAKKL